MSIEELKKRYKEFAISVAELIRELPMNNINNPYCSQLIRSSSSSAANYRAACRGKSTPDFINKMKIVEEELDESIFFLELLAHFNVILTDKISILLSEGNELLAITVQSIKTSRKSLNDATKKTQT
jgi:four helix bundle protein